MAKHNHTIRCCWDETVMPFVRKILKGILTILKCCYKIIIRIIAAGVLLALFATPFLSKCIDRVLAQWIWYPACASFLVLLVIDTCRRKEPIFKTPIFEFYSRIGEILVLPVLLSIFVFNYYNIDHIWRWVIFAMIALAVPLYLFSFYVFSLSQEQRSDEEKKTGALNMFKYILLYWLYDLLYMAIFNSWSMLIFTFGIIAIVVIFYNVTTVFLRGEKLLQCFLPFDLLLGIGLTTYLIYIIPDDHLREIVLTIVASVLGGLIALVGVAWTISHTNVARQEDFMRIERERKEEERKKHIPYIRISFDKEFPQIVLNANIRTGLDFENPEDTAMLSGKVFFYIGVQDFNIKNVSNANIIIKGVLLHQKYYAFNQTEIVEPGACCRIKTTNNYVIPMPQPEQSIALIVEDILGNNYKIICVVSRGRDSGGFQTVVKYGEMEYIGYNYSYTVSSAGLPTLTDNNFT